MARVRGASVRWAREGQAILVAAASVAAAEAFAFALPESAQPFHRAGFLVVLAAMIASAWRGGLVAGLAAGAVGLAGIMHVFLLYGGPLGPPPIRLTVGGTIGGFGLALAALIGYLRDRERMALDDVRRERASLDEQARALAEANARLREANAGLEAFSYVASHDLREPVRALGALTQALEEDEGSRLGPEGRERLAETRRAVERLSGLVASLLDLSRATRPGAVQLAPVDIGAAVWSEECTARFTDIVRERGARVTVTQAPGTAAARASLPLLGLALGNLVVNAVRHNKNPAPVVLVKVEPAQEEGHVEISVEDNGGGFSEAARRRLESLMRGDNPSSHAGFGLLLVFRAVSRLHGKVRLDRSADLGGAAVRVVLPAAQSEVAGEPGAAAAASGA